MRGKRSMAMGAVVTTTGAGIQEIPGAGVIAAAASARGADADEGQRVVFQNSPWVCGASSGEANAPIRAD
jgi:hypothetical protein